MQIWLVFCLITQTSEVISYIVVLVAVWLPLNGGGKQSVD